LKLMPVFRASAHR